MSNRQAGANTSSGERSNNFICHFGEIQNGALDGIAERYSGFCARYSRKEFNLLVLPPFIDEPYYGFLIGAEGPVCEGGIGGESSLHALHREPNGPIGQADESAVLALDVELVQFPKALIVHSVVRLERFYFSPLDIGKPIYEVMALEFPGRPLVGAADDGKVYFGFPLYVMPFGEGGCQDIQARADGVDADAELDVERARKRLLEERYYPILRSWRWRLFDTNLEINAGPGFDPLIEGFGLGYGPIYGRLSI